MRKLVNKVIWITGASSGIGEALALELAEKNTLVLSGRNLVSLEALKNKLTSKAKAIFVAPLDLEAHFSLTLVVNDVLEKVEHIDILINNGGISQRSLAEETGYEVNKRLMDINYLGTVELSRLLIPHFKVRKAGHFVVITSLTGKFGTPYRSGYAASKHALHGYFDSLRAELSAEGILVSMIAPGFVNTNVSINALTGDGSALNTMDDAQAKGISAKECAQKIHKAISSKKEEVFIGGKEVWGVHLKRFFPAIFSRVIGKAKVR